MWIFLVISLCLAYKLLEYREWNDANRYLSNRYRHLCVRALDGATNRVELLNLLDADLRAERNVSMLATKDMIRRDKHAIATLLSHFEADGLRVQKFGTLKCLAEEGPKPWLV